MNIIIYCQALILISLIANLLSMIYYDINGRPAKESLGFKGVVITLVVIAFSFLVYWKAGAFSMLFSG